MMKLIFMMIFMIPLFLFLDYWMLAILMLVLFFVVFFSYSFSIFYSSISYSLGLDLLSYLMIILSLWIGFLMYVSSIKIYFDGLWGGYFGLIVYLLIFMLVLSFSFMNLFYFYLFFEASLIPTLILILGWGYQPERLQAGLYLLFYTLLASFPMMIAIFYIYMNQGTLDFYFLYFVDNVYIYFLVNLVFFVKVPMYLVHLWLPKAHVEAPVSGSMILAGIMLKLGGYGLMRLMKIFLLIGVKLNLLFIVISLFGGVIISLVCLRQSDMKSLIAYSSVVHMGLMLGGILTLSYWGMMGGLVMMISHGLCSSGLFCLVNICYERSGSRSLYLNKGLINIFPSFSFWWFLLVACNMAAPPSLNLVGEIVLISSLIGFNSFFILFLSLISFLGAAYSLYLYSFSQHGKLNIGLFSMETINLREFYLLFMHWFPLILLVFKGDLVLLWL